MATVKPGQVWATKDKREPGRRVQVERVDVRYAYVVAVDGRSQPNLNSIAGRRRWHRDHKSAVRADEVAR